MKPIFVAFMEGRNTFARAECQLSNGMLTMHGHVTVEVLFRTETGEEFFWFRELFFDGGRLHKQGIR